MSRPRLVQHEPVLAVRVIFLTGGAFTRDASACLGRVPNLRRDKPCDLAHFRRLAAGRVSLAQRSRVH